jgi:hypothetical protein
MCDDFQSHKVRITFHKNSLNASSLRVYRHGSVSLITRSRILLEKMKVAQLVRYKGLKGKL